MKRCPECGLHSKGNDGIAEWFNCGSMVFNGESEVNPDNQTKICLQICISNFKNESKKKEDTTC